MKTRVYAPRGESRCSIAGCDAPYYGNTFCKKHHQWHWKRDLLPKPVEITIRDKLMTSFRVDPVTGCWIWTKGCNDRGYATISLPGQKRAYASRVSYETFIGPLGDKEACHKCDNPPCINPDHLFAGTHTENMRDSANKGRAKQPKNPLGTEHPRAVLDAETVLEIRMSKAPSKALGLLLGINPETVRRCRRRDTYRDI